MAFLRSVLLFTCVILTAKAASIEYPPGLDPASCPNFPFCGPSPVGAPAAAAPVPVNAVPAPAAKAAAPAQINPFDLAQHKQAEQRVLLLQQQLQQNIPAQQNTFTGLVGPSGVIGPAGAVGPAGPVAFHG